MGIKLIRICFFLQLLSQSDAFSIFFLNFNCFFTHDIYHSFELLSNQSLSSLLINILYMLLSINDYFS
jgi:hypothetical protein